MSRHQCRDCLEVKPASQFYVGKGRQPLPICKTCSKARANLTHTALRVLRDRHRDEYLAIRQALQEGTNP